MNLTRRGIAQLVVLTCVMGAPSAGAQPNLLWDRTFGGTGQELAMDVCTTNDGGCAIAGTTDSYGAGADDVYVVRTDADGDEVWSATFGGAAWEGVFNIEQTDDGGFIIGAATRSFGVGCDAYLIKTDANGNLEWQGNYGGDGGEYADGVHQTDDGGYVFAGQTSSYGAGREDFYLCKVDSVGTLKWQQTFGGSDIDWALDMQLTPDGGYVLVGRTLSYGAGNYDVYVVKADAAGEEEWSRVFGGPGREDGYSIQCTSDGGYVIVGFSASFGAGGRDLYMLRLDAAGDSLWTKTFGGTADEEGHGVRETADGGFIIAAETASFGNGGKDVWIIKTDAFGSEEWNLYEGGTYDDRSLNIDLTDDGGFYIAAETASYGAGGSDLWVLRYATEPTLALLSPLPGTAGGPNTFRVLEGTFGAEMTVMYSLSNAGSWQVPNCEGSELDLWHPSLVGKAIVDVDEIANVTVEVPPIAQGVTVSFQAYEESTCKTSNLVEYTFE